MEEDRAHCPPPSLVPRLHCLFYNKIEDSHPHVRNQSVEYGKTFLFLSYIIVRKILQDFLLCLCFPSFSYETVHKYTVWSFTFRLNELLNMTFILLLIWRENYLFFCDYPYPLLCSWGCVSQFIMDYFWNVAKLK